MKLTTGTVLQSYTIIEAIGEGGMGEVYLAEETLLGRQVAIKRLNPSLTNDSHFSERFINEARIQAKLQHQNIVGLYSFLVEQDVYYMVMEYAAGLTLKELILMTGPIPEARTLNIFKQIVDALGYAHSRGIIHRDIKPSNIIIDDTDRVKVMDFGIARLMSDKHLTRTGAKLGTLFYMSPEQVMALKDIDHRTDIYSAGILLYEMLTGRLPFSEDTESDFIVMKEITETRTPDPREVYPHISVKTVAALDKATQKDREQRYQDCQTLFDDCCGDGSARIPLSPINPNSQPQREKPVNPKPADQPKSVVPFEMVFVEGGTFEMGNTKPGLMQKLMGGYVLHEVRLSSFYLGRYPVTQEKWTGLMGQNPSYWQGKDLPVQSLSWYSAVDYCNKLSLIEGLSPCYSGKGERVICDWTANGYRLPTEAEWEYAARGGQQSNGHQYSGSDDIDSVAWHERNSENHTHPVGSKEPNQLGLFDMSGNLWEWCWDIYARYTDEAQHNPTGADIGRFRVLRGGSWNSNAGYCDVQTRSYESAEFISCYSGFRLCRNCP